MKFAILAAPALIPYLNKMLGALNALSGTELELYDYGKLSNLRTLYPEIRESFDGFILSGLAVQTALQRYFPEDQKPVAVFDTELEEIYHALLVLLDKNRELDLSKVIVDIYFQVNEGHTCRSLLDIKDMDAARKRTMNFWEKLSAEDLDGLGDRLFSSIEKRYKEGKISFVISRNSAIEPMLSASDIPHVFLYPSQKQVVRTIKGLSNRIVFEKNADYTAAVVAVARENKNILAENDDEEFRLQQTILDYKKETTADFQLQKTGNLFFLFTNLKSVSAMTGNFRYCSLNSFLKKKLGFSTFVGYGVANGLSDAKNGALEALRESIYRKASYAMVEGSLVGPLMPGAEPLLQGPLDESIMSCARNSALSPGTIRKIKAIIDYNGNNELTAAELSERLNVKIRNTNRILERLTEAGYATQVGMRSTGTKGRPTRIYRIEL